MKPIPVFPAAVATDEQLGIAADRLQTRLTVAMDAAVASMTVASSAGMEAGVLLTIDQETVQVTGAPVGNVVPISRAFGGSVAAIHANGALVSAYIDAWHHNALVSEVQAIEETLIGSSSVTSAYYDFDAQSPAESLIAGGVNQAITLSPVPPGVSGANIGQPLRLTGPNAETVTITGGTAVPGAASGTVTFTPANSHAAGSYSVKSATAGIKEAIQSLPATGGVIVIPAGSHTIYQTVVAGNGALGVASAIQGITIQGRGPGATRLEWAGPADGIMVEFRGPMNDGGLSDVTLDCDGIAATGLKVLAHSTANYRRITVLKNTGYAFTVDVWPAQDAGPVGTGDNTFEDLTAITTETLGSGISVGADSAATSAEIDPCRNAFRRLQFYIGAQGIGIRLGYTDSSSFHDVFTLRGIAGLYLRTADGAWGQYFPGAINCYGCYFFPNSVAPVAISNATNASPIRVTTAAPHGLTTGMRIAVSGVQGNAAANGVHNVTVINATTVDLDGSIGNGAYTLGGYIGGIPVLAKGAGPANGGGGIKDGASFWPWNIEMGDPPLENWAHGVTATGKPFGWWFSRLLSGLTDPSIRVNNESGTNNLAGIIEFCRLYDPRLRIVADYVDGLSIYTKDGAGAFTRTWQLNSAGLLIKADYPVHADNAAAKLAGLAVGTEYCTAAGARMVVVP